MKTAIVILVIAVSVLILWALRPDRAVASEIVKKIAGITVEPFNTAPFPSESEPYKSNVAVVTPQNLDRSAAKINIVVFFHGFYTDVSQSDFIDSIKKGFDSAYGESTDTVMIAPQLAYNAKDRSAGSLEEKNGLHRIIIEAFERNSIEGRIGNVTLVSYSGGYWALTKCLVNNPSLDITRAVFLDTLYWHADDVLDWVEAEGRMVVVFSSEEKASQSAKYDYFLMAANYFLNSPAVETSEEDFFAKKLEGKFIIVDTTKPHGLIPSLMGPVLKKLKG